MIAREYIGFRMKKEKAAELVRAYKQLEAKLSSQGFLEELKKNDLLLPRYFRSIERILKSNGYPV